VIAKAFSDVGRRIAAVSFVALKQVLQFLHEAVFANVDIAGCLARSCGAAGVAVAAAVAGATVNPVPVHPTVAHPAHRQPGQHVPTRATILGVARSPDPLNSNKHGLIDQRRMRQPLRYLPLPYRIPAHST
jgi:hypothetical protein